MIKFLKNYFVTSYHRPTAKILHIYVFLKSFFYNKKTTIFSEKMFLLKSPPNSMVYYNFFGRFFTWKFKKNWRSLVYNYTHTYHIEFLGKKLP